MYKFAAPYYLLLIPVVALIFFKKWNKIRGIKIPSIYTVKKEGKKIYKHNIEKILTFISLVLMIIALARPQIVSQSVKTKKNGIDIVIALDLSRSMLQEDFKPNRLEKAKSLLKEFVAKRADDRISIVVFGGEAYTKVPLTFDHEVIQKILGKLTTGDITSNNRTAIGMGLGVAVNRVKNSESKSKVIILMTDGENNSGEMSPGVAADIAKEYNIKVYTIGIGAYEVLTPTMTGRRIMANTELDETLLKSIASKTGGEYFRASGTEKFREIFDKINNLEKTKIESTEFYSREELYEKFLKVAIMTLLIALLFRYLIYIKIP